MKRVLLILVMIGLTIVACDAGSLPSEDNTEDSPEPFVTPAPPNVCNIRPHDAHISSHQKAKGIIQIVAQVSYGCIEPLPRSHELTLRLERRNDDGSWRVLTSRVCCPNPRLAPDMRTAPLLTLGLMTPDGRTCVDGAWRLHATMVTVNANGQTSTQEAYSPYVREITCPS